MLKKVTFYFYEAFSAPHRNAHHLACHRLNTDTEYHSPNDSNELYTETPMTFQEQTVLAWELF